MSVCISTESMRCMPPHLNSIVQSAIQGFQRPKPRNRSEDESSAVRRWCIDCKFWHSEKFRPQNDWYLHKCNGGAIETMCTWAAHSVVAAKNFATISYSANVFSVTFRPTRIRTHTRSRQYTHAHIHARDDVTERASERTNTGVIWIHRRKMQFQSKKNQLRIV